MNRYPARSCAALIAAALLVLATPAFALPQDPVDTTVHSLTLKNGDAVRGQILEASANTYKMKVFIAGGSMTRSFNLADFDDKTQVRLMSMAVPEGDVMAQFDVAKFAADKGLVNEARRELRRCSYMLDGLPAEKVEAFKKKATYLVLRLLKTMCDRGQVSEARAAVSRILTKHAARLTEQESTQIVETVETAAKDYRAKQFAAKRAKTDAAEAKKIDKRLTTVRKHVDQSLALRRKGLLSSKSFSTAESNFNRAIRGFEASLKEADKVMKQFGNEPAVAAAVNEMKAQALDGWKDTLLANASLKLTRGRFTKAMADVNRILADEPKNKLALAMRARIEVAANEWGWR